MQELQGTTVGSKMGTICPGKTAPGAFLGLQKVAANIKFGEPITATVLKKYQMIGVINNAAGICMVDIYRVVSRK